MTTKNVERKLKKAINSYKKEEIIGGKYSLDCKLCGVNIPLKIYQLFAECPRCENVYSITRKEWDEKIN